MLVPFLNKLTKMASESGRVATTECIGLLPVPDV